MDIKEAGKLTVSFALNEALIFGVGALLGKMIGRSPVLMGAIGAVNGFAIGTFKIINTHFSEKFDWKLSTRLISQALGCSLFGITTAVTLFALGLIGPIGAGVIGGVFGFGFLFQAGIAVYLKVTDEDISYNNAKEPVKEGKVMTVAQTMAMV